MQLRSLPNDKGPRLAVIAGRRAWQRAVDRNRFKRLVREAFRVLQHSLQRRDYVVRALGRQAEAPSATAIELLLCQWRRNEDRERA